MHKQDTVQSTCDGSTRPSDIARSSAPIDTGLPQCDLALRRQVIADLSKEKLVEHLIQDTTLL